MQQSSLSTLNPSRSSERMRKLREAAMAEADAVPPGVIAHADESLSFDVSRKKPSQPCCNPEDSVGAAKYSGPNSEHIGNGHGSPQ